MIRLQPSFENLVYNFRATDGIRYRSSYFHTSTKNIDSDEHVVLSIGNYDGTKIWMMIKLDRLCNSFGWKLMNKIYKLAIKPVLISSFINENGNETVGYDFILSGDIHDLVKYISDIRFE